MSKRENRTDYNFGMGLRRGGALVAALVVLLVVVLLTSAMDAPAAVSDQSAAVNKLLDKAGVTQRAAFVDWIEDTASPEEGPDTPVWMGRSGHTYHSFPLCAKLKNPVKITLGEAEAQGLTPCKDCWGY